MKIESLLSRILPFLLTLACGVFLGSWFSPSEVVKPSSGNGSGSGYDFYTGTPAAPRGEIEARPGTNALRVVSKPQAKYTDEARVNNVQGKVRLKVELLASGQVGAISVVETLPYGLTEQAIAAARLLRFEPATKDGVPISKTITIDYSFTIY